MKIQSLFILFFVGIFFAHAQNDNGILIKTTLNPRVGGYSTRYTIEGRKDDLIRFTTGNIQPTNQTLVQYNFYYITDINQLYYLALQMDSSNNVRCVQEYTVPYNTKTTSDQYFSSCFGYSNVYAMHLTQPDDNSICANENISLNNGWNWQYRYNDTTWKDFPNEYQNQRSISFKIKELIGYENKSQIFFQTGYKTNFTNTVIYNIIPCSSDLLNTSTPNYTKCNYSNGDVTFTFNRPLETGENYLFTRNPVGSNMVTSANSNEVDKVEKISATTFKWKDIPPGDYEFKYQNLFENNTPSTLSPVSYFTMTPRQQLTFIITPLQPNCHDEQGAVKITASGGTPPYYYMIDTETLLQKHPLTADPIQLSEGDHKIIVVDSQDCIEK